MMMMMMLLLCVDVDVVVAVIVVCCVLLCVVCCCCRCCYCDGVFLRHCALSHVPGTLLIDHSSLHIVCAATHCFGESLMNTVIRENVNPVEKVERSNLIVASVVHGQAVDSIVDAGMQCLEREGDCCFLLLMPFHSVLFCLASI
jgi:hypothetical protein